MFWPPLFLYRIQTYPQQFSLPACVITDPTNFPNEPKELTDFHLCTLGNFQDLFITSCVTELGCIYMTYMNQRRGINFLGEHLGSFGLFVEPLHHWLCNQVGVYYMNELKELTDFHLVTYRFIWVIHRTLHHWLCSYVGVDDINEPKELANFHLGSFRLIWIICNTPSSLVVLLSWGLLYEWTQGVG